MVQAERILIVDDERSIRAAVEHSLKKYGYEFLQADSAELAIEMLSREQVNCVISDLRMPGMGGHGLVRHCGSLNPPTPIVVISGMADKDDLVELLRQGVSDYVDKPWSASELSSAVRRAIEKSRQLQAPAFAAQSAEPAPTAGPVAVSGPDDIDPQLAAALQKKLFQVLEELRQGQISIPASARIAVEVRRTASSRTASMQALTALIERDASISGRVIQLANSAYYRGQGKVMDLSAAVRRIGFGEIVQVIDTVVSHQYYNVDDPLIKDLLQGLWLQSWARAVMMRQLAEALPELNISQDKAYLGGLFVDLGVPFLLRILASDAKQIPRDLIVDFVRQHHSTAGAAICRQWTLPAEVAELAKQHHDKDSDLDFVKLCRAADHLIADIGYARSIWGIDADADSLKKLPLSHLAIITLKNRAEKHLTAHLDDFSD